MKQLKNNYICYYCLGCLAEEMDNFMPKRNCKNFIPAYTDWQEIYYKSLKEENKNDNN